MIYDDGRGNTIYRVPRRYPARVRVVETRRLDALRPPRNNQDVVSLSAYADVVEHGPTVPATLIREGTDAMRVRTQLQRGQSIVVLQSYDPAWQAWSGKQRVPIGKDAMGFLAITAPLGDQELRSVFVTPLENQAGRVATFLTLVILLALFARGMIPQRSS